MPPRPWYKIGLNKQKAKLGADFALLEPVTLKLSSKSSFSIRRKTMDFGKGGA